MSDQEQAVHVPTRGSKGSRSGFIFRLLHPLMVMQVRQIERAQSPEPVQQMGFPVGLLTTVGARTGKERTTVLGFFPDGQDAWLIVGSKGGAADNPGWLHNIAQNPDKVWAQVGNRKFRASVRSLTGVERDQAYSRVCEVAPRYGTYLKKTDREIPVLRVTPQS